MWRLISETTIFESIFLTKIRQLSVAETSNYNLEDSADIDEKTYDLLIAVIIISLKW